MVDIIYKDRQVCVCIKPVGVSAEADMPRLLAEQLGVREVRCVHRLDNAVGGVMVYALTQKSAADLSRQIAERAMEKEYFAVLCGTPVEPTGTLRDLLFKDSRLNKSFVVDRMRKGVREAELHYDVRETREGLTLVHVRLVTGRSHQIRVQFSHRKMPLWGDRRYGAKTGEGIALFSCGVSFRHPVSGGSLHFEAKPQGEPWNMFDLG